MFPSIRNFFFLKKAESQTPAKLVVTILAIILGLVLLYGIWKLKGKLAP
jgi:hypothetical protein